MTLLWNLLLIFGIAGYVYCKCTVTPLITEKTTLGRAEQYCVYNVTKGNVSIPINVRLGSNLEFHDTCIRCRCTQLGMSCCGFGVYGEGTIHVPYGCTAIPDGCNVAIVSIVDNRTDCFGPRGPVGRQRQQQYQVQKAMRGFLRHEHPAAMNFLDTKPFRGGPNAPAGEKPRRYPDNLLETMLLLNMVGTGPSIGAAAGAGAGMGMGAGGDMFGGPLGMGLLSMMMS